MIEISKREAKFVFGGLDTPTSLVTEPLGMLSKAGGIALTPKKAITGDPSGGSNTKGGQRKAEKGKGK